MTVRDALLALDTIAPPHLALGDDPRGLLVGDPNAALRGGITVALDVTAAVVEAARQQNAGLIVAHHPLIYTPLRRLCADDAHPGAVVLACAAAGIAVACAHTNWDVAPGGINDVLANLLTLSDVRPLQITYRESLVNLCVFVPTEYREKVFAAMTDAGAGAIGHYDRCGFWTTGTGTFRPLPGANPFLGEGGKPRNGRGGAIGSHCADRETGCRSRGDEGSASLRGSRPLCVSGSPTRTTNTVSGAWANFRSRCEPTFSISG